MKKIYATPTLEVFEYIPEGQLLTQSYWEGKLDDGSGENDGEGMDGGDAWTNKREPNTPWGKSPWE